MIYLGICISLCYFFFFKQKTAYEMRISDWSSTCALPISLLLMYPEGDGEHREHGIAGDYLVMRWAPAAVDAHLLRAGFTVAWEHTAEGRGGSWRSVLARRKTPARRV